MRKLEKDIKKRDNLRDKILKKYGKKGLHIAQVVQNGIFSRFLGTILERAPTAQALKTEIVNLFENIENRVVFIQRANIKGTKYIKNKTEEIIAKIRAHSPEVFVISSAGTAMETCKKIANDAINKILDYTYELVETENKRMYFLIKKI
ncbi:MAG: hypothetical protein QW835_03735 [Candidatus Hadarchaeum sp.]